MDHVLTPPLAAYPYVQYNDDDDVVAFFMSFNSLAQGYVDFFNQYDLADYNSPLMSGDLLDWCAEGIYGVPRPFLVMGIAGFEYGPYGTTPYGELEFGGYEDESGSGITYSYVSDQIYKRVIDWNFYKGDGLNFNITWLKRRVIRFLSGDAYPDQTFDVSVSFPIAGQVEIEIPSSYDLADTLSALVDSRIVNLPFQYSFTVSVV